MANTGAAKPMWTLATSFADYELMLEAGCWRARKPLHPMEVTLQQIERALEVGLFYAAVVMALTLPDICAALEDEQAYSGRDEYKKWYRENLAERFPSMTDADAYSLRCGVVHKGNLGLKSKGSAFKRVVFTLPAAHGGSAHNCVMDDVLQFDAVLFCYEIMDAVRRWCERTKTDPIVRTNLPNLVRYRPDGLRGYMFAGGPIAVIA